MCESKRDLENNFFFRFQYLGTELSEAKDKLSRVESSSSDSEDEGTNKRKKIEVGEKPSEEMVEKMEEKLEAANVDQKRLFLIVFQRFIMILSEHLVRCDTDGQDFDTDWYRWTIGRLQQVFLLVSSNILFTHLIYGKMKTKTSHFTFLLASRASTKVQQYIGNAALLIRS